MKKPCPNYESWHGYLEVRKQRKYPITARVITLLVNKLLKLRSESHDIGKCLDNATLRGWSSVYPSEDSFIQPKLHKKIDGFKRTGKVIGMREVAIRFKEQGLIK